MGIVPFVVLTALTAILLLGGLLEPHGSAGQFAMLFTASTLAVVLTLLGLEH